MQAGLALWLAPALTGLLLVVWGYMALMTREFWLRDYLRERPFTTLWTHMLIIPLIDFYATACDWIAVSGTAPVVRAGLLWFLLASFCNGVVVEIGRKLRAPEDEESGVETYTRVWGRTRAIVAWLAAMALTAVCAIAAASHVGGTMLVAGVLGVLLAASAMAGVGLARAPRKGRGRRLEILAGLWTIALYLTVGVVPFLLGRQAFGG